MYNISMPSDAQRAKLQRLVDTLGVNMNDYVISPHTLRLERRAVAGQNAYSFDFYQNPGADRPQEHKLNRNDVLAITEIALGVTKEDTSTTPPRYGNYPLFTFPDPVFFLGVPTAPALTEAQCLETIYNGKLSLKTNNTDRLPSLLTSHLRYRPQSASTGALHPEYGPSLPERGFFPIEPQLILNGQQNNTATLEIGSGETAAIAGGINASNVAVNTRNVIVLLVHGFLISEAAEAALRWQTY